MSDVRGDSWSSIADQKHIRTQMISVEDQRRMTDVMRKQGQRPQGVDEEEIGRWWGEKGGTMGRKRMNCEERVTKKMGISTKHMLVRTSHGGVENKKGSQGTGILGKIRNHAEEWRMVRNAKKSKGNQCWIVCLQDRWTFCGRIRIRRTPKWSCRETMKITA